MKWWAFFYDENDYNLCGDRSLIIIDGRLSRWNAIQVASRTCENRGFRSFSLSRSESLRDIPLSETTSVRHGGRALLYTGWPAKEPGLRQSEPDKLT